MISLHEFVLQPVASLLKLLVFIILLLHIGYVCQCVQQLTMLKM